MQTVNRISATQPKYMYDNNGMMMATTTIDDKPNILFWFETVTIKIHGNWDPGDLLSPLVSNY